MEKGIQADSHFRQAVVEHPRTSEADPMLNQMLQPGNKYQRVAPTVLQWCSGAVEPSAISGLPLQPVLSVSLHQPAE